MNDAVYAAYIQGNRKNQYFKNDLKMEWIIRSEDGSIKEIIPSLEDSLDSFMGDNAAQYTDVCENLEDCPKKQVVFICFSINHENITPVSRNITPISGKTSTDLLMLCYT